MRFVAVAAIGILTPLPVLKAQLDLSVGASLGSRSGVIVAAPDRNYAAHFQSDCWTWGAGLEVLYRKELFAIGLGMQYGKASWTEFYKESGSTHLGGWYVTGGETRYSTTVLTHHMWFPLGIGLAGKNLGLQLRLSPGTLLDSRARTRWESDFWAQQSIPVPSDTSWQASGTGGLVHEDLAPWLWGIGARWSVNTNWGLMGAVEWTYFQAGWLAARENDTQDPAVSAWSVSVAIRVHRWNQPRPPRAVENSP